MKIIETLDYGYSLLEDGTILKKDGTIITKEEYEQMQQNIARNKLEWIELDADEALKTIETAQWIAKISARENDISISNSSQLLAGFDIEAEPFYIRISEFAGAEQFYYANADYGRLIYTINQNRPDLTDDLQSYLEETFGTKEQIGSSFDADEETSITIKKFIKDGYLWKMIFRNGQISNIKKEYRIHREMEAKGNDSKDSIQSKIAQLAIK